MLNVQALKDTFYAMLQGRLAGLNAARMIVVRGVSRPGVLVTENELPGAAIDGVAPAEAFCLRWTTLNVDAENAGALLTLGCEIRYASDGTAGNGGMDRGRSLAAMDAELATALIMWPRQTAAELFTESAGGGVTTGAPLAPVASNIFWGEPAFGTLVTRGERLERTALMEVYGYGQ